MSPVVVIGFKLLNAAAADVALVPPLAIGSVPVTPVVKGKPVAFVKVTDVGVPKTGVTSVGLVLKTVLPVPVEVVTPVPPFATANVPLSVMVPLPVTGPPEVVNPVVPPLTCTLVTVPDVAGAAQVGTPPATVKIWPVEPIANLAAVPALAS